MQTLRGGIACICLHITDTLCPLILVCILKLMASHPHRQNIIARLLDVPLHHTENTFHNLTDSSTFNPSQNPHRAPLAINNREPLVPLFIPRQLGPRPRRNKNVSFWCINVARCLKLDVHQRCALLISRIRRILKCLDGIIRDVAARREVVLVL
jgi:hypothetical protein